MPGYIQFTIPATSALEKELAIAQLIMAGFENFEERGDAIIAAMSTETYDAAFILERITLPFSTQLLPEKNWNEEWEKSFQPVLVDNFCLIRADFHPEDNEVQYEIVITPKMSFGTGHHATTYQMIALMKDLDFNEKKVLDFGTGTGVLAILAEKMGASYINAVDNDKWSIDNARENFLANNSSRIVLTQASELVGLQKFDIILANINKHVILQQLESMKQHLKKVGVMLISGLLASDFSDIRAATADCGLSIVQHSEKDNWIALTLKY